MKEFLKGLYDFTKCTEDSLPSGDALPELIIQGFDEEQIWQELELQNEGRSQGLVADVASLVAHKDILKFPVRLKNEERENEDVSNDGELQKDDDDDSTASASTSENGMFMPSDKDTAMKKRKGWLVCCIFSVPMNLCCID